LNVSDIRCVPTKLMVMNKTVSYHDYHVYTAITSLHTLAKVPAQLCHLFPTVTNTMEAARRPKYRTGPRFSV